MNNTNAQFGNSNFVLYYNFRERFADKQVNPERIGDLGDVSDKFKKNAMSRDKYKASGFHDFAANPEKYTAPELSGTDGRDNNKNYNRMEYDEVQRNDSKSHSDVMSSLGSDPSKVMSQLDKTRDQIVKGLAKGKFAWDINTLDYAMGTDPITADDYAE
jgi:hypothetical protein